jgi:hypothetical protein
MLECHLYHLHHHHLHTPISHLQVKQSRDLDHHLNESSHLPSPVIPMFKVKVKEAIIVSEGDRYRSKVKVKVKVTDVMNVSIRKEGGG